MSAGAIHDLGYKRYLGTRRPQSTRWRVIVRNQVGYAWKTWWRSKLALGWSIVTLLSFTAIMLYLFQLEDPLEKFGKTERFLARFGLGGDPYDTLISLAVPWLTRAAFLASLTVGAGTIAADAQVGAFTFYFARPVRPLDYVAGKLGGLFLLNTILVTAPLFALTLLRVGLSPDLDHMIAALPRILSALATGSAAALLFSALPLAVSSLVRRRAYAIAGWAVIYIVVGGIAEGIAHKSRTPWLQVFDPLGAIDSIGQHLYDAKLMTRVLFDPAPLGVAVAAVIALSAGAIALAYAQVARRAYAGVGGS